MAEHVVAWTGAVCAVVGAVVGAVVVVAVPDASAAGLVLALLGVVLAVRSLMRGPTSRTGCAGHSDSCAHDGRHVGAAGVSR